MSGPGHGGPAKGPGWGGPAKGLGHGGPAVALTPEMRSAGGKASHDQSDEAKMRRQIRKERTEALEWKLYQLAMEAEHQNVQMQAAARLHEIYNGKPRQQVEIGGIEDGEPVQTSVRVSFVKS